MDHQFRALRIVGTIYKILGGIAGILTILLVIGICGTSFLGGAALGSAAQQFGNNGGLGGMFGGVVGGLIASVVAILYGGGIAVTLFAFGEGIYLLLALEENTRTTAQYLSRTAEKPS
ncbi:MAG: hypothetical protein WBZ24_01525 [Anaerolineales bacterium]